MVGQKSEKASSDCISRTNLTYWRPVLKNVRKNISDNRLCVSRGTFNMHLKEFWIATECVGHGHHRQASGHCVQVMDVTGKKSMIAMHSMKHSRGVRLMTAASCTRDTQTKACLFSFLHVKLRLIFKFHRSQWHLPIFQWNWSCWQGFNYCSYAGQYGGVEKLKSEHLGFSQASLFLDPKTHPKGSIIKSICCLFCSSWHKKCA